MPLRQAIAQALTYATPPPQNEAATLMRVIDPLLTAMGYSPMDIEPESTVTPGVRPDRTLLPDTDAEWYLEAKSWGVSLDDPRSLQQATSYAHSRGKRWVVLTNGQVWRIYDDHITGAMPADRLVAEARLDDADQMAQLLEALSKPSMVFGNLGQFAVRARVRATLTRQLKDDGSDAVKALVAIVRKQPGLSQITKRDIADYFRDVQAAVQPDQSPKVITPAPVPGSPTPTPARTPPTHNGTGPKTFFTVDDAGAATGAKPAALVLPDGSRVEANSWRDVACELIEWLSKHRSLPVVPYQGGLRGDRYFLNSSPKHKSEPMQGGYRELHLSGGPVFVDLHRSAADLFGRLTELCHLAQVDPKAVKVELR